MKKGIGSILIIMFFTTMRAFAGTNAEAIPLNNNSEQTTTQNKANNKYNFTLFNFFTSNDAKVKNDTANTDPKVNSEKVKKPVNSGL